MLLRLHAQVFVGLRGCVDLFDLLFIFIHFYIHLLHRPNILALVAIYYVQISFSILLAANVMLLVVFRGR